MSWDRMPNLHCLLRTPRGSGEAVTVDPEEEQRGRDGQQGISDSPLSPPWLTINLGVQHR